MNEGLGHQLQRNQRNYNLLKSKAEERLYKLMMDGKVKVGTPEYDDRCAAIEYYDIMASREAERYDENN